MKESLRIYTCICMLNVGADNICSIGSRRDGMLKCICSSFEHQQYDNPTKTVGVH